MNLINITFIRRNHEKKEYLRERKPEIKIKGRLYGTTGEETYYTHRLFMHLENVFIKEGIYNPLRVSSAYIEASQDTIKTINSRAFAIANLQAKKKEKSETRTIQLLILALILETLFLFFRFGRGGG